MKKGLFLSFALAALMLSSAAYAAPSVPARAKAHNGGLTMSAAPFAQAAHSRALSDVNAAPAKRASENSGILTTAPEGETAIYSCSGYGYTLTWMGISFSYMAGTAKEIVKTDDAIYIKNPFLGFVTNSYLKAERNGDKYTAKLPVLLYEEESYGFTYSYTAAMLRKKTTPEGNITYEATGDSVVNFVEKDGNIILDLGYDPQPDAEGYIESPEVIFALIDGEGNWSGVGDGSQVYTPFTETAMTPPAGLKAEEWAMTLGDTGRFVKVGFDGNDVWMQGLFSMLPEAWIKGEVKGDTVVVPSLQYLGTSSGYFVYLINCNLLEQGQVSLLPEITFNYDAGRKYMTPCNASDIMIFNAGKETVAYLEYIQAPTLHLQGADSDKKVRNPRGLEFNDYFESSGMAFFDFVLPIVSVDGDLLDTSTMYYNILFDGEVETFYHDEYPVDVEDEITDIPFSFGTQSFWYDKSGNPSRHEIVVYARGLKTIGVQLFNKDGDTIHKSEIVTIPVGDNSIEEAPVDAEAASEEWYSIDGRRIEAGAKGLSIRKVTYTDGTVRTLKQIVK